MRPAYSLSYAAATAWSAGWPALAKWLVPVVKEPGTTIVESIPNRASSAA